MSTDRTSPRAEAKRAQLLDAAELVMYERGYAAVSSRSIGAAAGMPAPLVNYYFGTLDNLFVEMLRRGVARAAERFDAAVATPQPLRALWALHLDKRGATVAQELATLSNHRPSVREALLGVSGAYQERQITAVRGIFDRYGFSSPLFPPELAVLALGGITRLVVREQLLGVSNGHEVAMAAVERLLDELEPLADAPRAARPPRKRTS